MNTKDVTTDQHFYAHTGLDANGHDWQLLADHLIAVGEGAKSRARAIDRYRSCRLPVFEIPGSIAGWLHDLGKYRSEFQDHLFGRRVDRVKTYHKQAGAAKAAMLNYVPTAFAIAGHHGGIPTRSDLMSAVLGPGGKDVMEAVWQIASSQNPAISQLTTNPAPESSSIDIDFASRIVLSCLVDADWDDTSRFHRRMNGLESEATSPVLEPTELLSRLMAYIESRSVSCPDMNIRAIRQEVLDSCVNAANDRPGIYSLTVPTGGGKTLSSLAFALRHAVVHGFRRVVYVAPYLSIIDQNSQVIRAALSLHENDPVLFAHHSLSDPIEFDDKSLVTSSIDEMEAMRRAENWDSPIVVTTNVQFFESLFSNKPARCRKLHNLAGSVILLDECQSLPPELIVPTCSMLRKLSADLGCTIVLCTATQPVFSHPSIPKEDRLESREITPDPASLFRRLHRVELQWPADGDFMTWRQVSDCLCDNQFGEPAALCIVNSRRAARELFAELTVTHMDGVFHLSTSMCPFHRMRVLDEVRQRLKAKRKCILVSTQLIEAGVDVDFPLVMREMAPLESIIQAAGRCNREGVLRSGGESIKGRTVIFRSTVCRDEPARYFPPDQWYKAGRQTLEASFLAAGREPRLDRPEDISDYYQRLFFSGRLDGKDIQRSRVNLDFVKVANDYRLIDDDSVSIVVGSWEQKKQEIDELLDRVGKDPSRANFRRLAPFHVNVRRHEMASQARALVARPFENLDLRVWLGQYDDAIGMSADQSDLLMIV